MSEPTRVTVPVWYLEMASPADLVPRSGPGEVRRAAVPLGALNRFFYEEIGRDFDWVDRLAWAGEQWQAWAERTELWIVHDRGTPAGYAELEPRPDGSVDVAFFGILQAFRGRGLGGQLLARAVQRAWELGPDRVTVNTCALDGPYARAHYEARGFRVVREVVEERGKSAIL
ncbi:MAG TPA: GNAT family N-acetyltransferase [Solirubrobacteraceae bacterium]|jgi:GNAT superfamily N-acetyltransferase